MKDRVRYYIVVKGHAYWRTTPAMKKLGFENVPLGKPGPDAIRRAEELNAMYDARVKETKATPAQVETYPHGTLGWMFADYKKSHTWDEKAERTKEEWDWCWRRIKPVFADVAVSTISFRHCDAFYRQLSKTLTLSETHKTYKIFRALLNVGIAYQLLTTNPSEGVRNVAPKGRSAIWLEPEVEVLVKAAYEKGEPGLGLILAIAYDSALRSQDVRTLLLEEYDPATRHFARDQIKTSKAIAATVSEETARMIATYTKTVVSLPGVPFIRNTEGQPYSSSALTQAFARLRHETFGADEKRQLRDVRRTAVVETSLGGADASTLAHKTGNTIQTSNKLHATYNPVQLEHVQKADAARVEGKKKLAKRQAPVVIHTPPPKRDLPVGVYPYRFGPGFTATVKIGKKLFHLGVFATAEAASEARERKRQDMQAGGPSQGLDQNKAGK